jgi:NitT/TauT family transport system substrate-binding protein
MKQTLSILPLLVLLAGLSGCASAPVNGTAPAGAATEPERVRLGYFANVTHAQALVGVARGDFQKSLGASKLETRVFNAGPEAVEALFAGELDVTYIGPSPAINAYLKSRGTAVRIVAGSAANGVSIVARKDSGIASTKDLAGKRIATPQFGNTQDVSARHYLKSVLSRKLKEDGGETEILPVKNAEQIALFRSGQIDAAWAPEPWGARLVHEAGGVLIAEEKDLWPEKKFAITVVLVATKFLEEHPRTVERLLKAHVELTGWLNEHPSEAKAAVNAELARLTGKPVATAVLDDTFARTMFLTDPLPKTVAVFVDWSRELGFTRETQGIDGLFELKLLENAVAGQK